MQSRDLVKLDLGLPCIPSAIPTKHSSLYLRPRSPGRSVSCATHRSSFSPSASSAAPTRILAIARSSGRRWDSAVLSSQRYVRCTSLALRQAHLLTACLGIRVADSSVGDLLARLDLLWLQLYKAWERVRVCLVYFERIRLIDAWDAVC